MSSVGPLNIECVSFSDTFPSKSLRHNSLEGKILANWAENVWSSIFWSNKWSGDSGESTNVVQRSKHFIGRSKNCRGKQLVGRVNKVWLRVTKNWFIGPKFGGRFNNIVRGLNKSVSINKIWSGVSPKIDPVVIHLGIRICMFPACL